MKNIFLQDKCEIMRMNIFILVSRQKKERFLRTSHQLLSLHARSFSSVCIRIRRAAFQYQYMYDIKRTKFSIYSDRKIIHSISHHVVNNCISEHRVSFAFTPIS